MPTLDFGALEITTPISDLVLVDPGPPNLIRRLDVVPWSRALRAAEASEEGIVYPRTHNYSGPVSIGTITLGDVVEVINGWNNTFEDGQYAVRLNGANNNVEDVTNVNQVSIRSANSAGLTYSQELVDLHKSRGLKKGDPLLIRDDEQIAGDVELDVSDDGTTTTVSRR